jgi:hypothetical protein
MSATTLSQRLRDFSAKGYNSGRFNKIDVDTLLSFAKEAEAQEAQAGELSDEEVGRAAMDSIPADSHVGLALDEDGAIDMARAFFERGLRYARDHGYMKPSQAIGEQTPVAWMSKDYCALYDLLCEGRDAFCLVDMSFTNPDHVCRDVARVRRREEWRIDIGARGIGYGDVTPYGKNRHATERDALVKECKRMNLEWIAPISPEARDRAIEALDLSKEALPYAYDDRNGNTVTPWNLEVTRAIKKVDQAISALRGS